MSRTIALTGATGFIGSTLAKRLHSAGWQIQALVRPNSERSRLAGLPVKWITGDLENAASLRELVRNTSAIIHCAGIVRGITAAQFNRVNFDGVARLVQTASEQHPLPRFFLISSLAAREPHLSPYANSKRQGEQVLFRRAGAMPWTALRPSAVYGPGDREMLRLFQWAQRGVAPILASDKARLSVLYVDDLAAAVLALIQRGRCRQNIFELHDGRQNGYSWQEVIDIVADLYNRKILRIHVPELILRLIAGLNLVAARIFGYDPMLTPGKVRELTHHNWVCDNTNIQRSIDWVPQISLKEGLRRTL
jgi:nucleoside-diphosphate-sugar epimerase